MSEFVINLIILLVIIVSVLKRVNEVKQKSRELGKKSPAPKQDTMTGDGRGEKPLWEKMAEDIRTEMRSYPESTVLEKEPAMDYDIDETLPVESTVDVTERRAEDLLREASFTKQPSEDEFERLQAEQRELTETLNSMSSMRTGLKSRLSVSERMLPVTGNISFSRSSVVTGIVMSEILGPPVSMRRGNDVW